MPLSPGTASATPKQGSTVHRLVINRLTQGRVMPPNARGNSMRSQLFTVWLVATKMGGIEMHRYTAAGAYGQGEAAACKVGNYTCMAGCSDWHIGRPILPLMDPASLNHCANTKVTQVLLP